MNMHTSFGGFGVIDFDAPLEEEEPITAPMAGSAKLVIEDKYQPLFLTAEWVIVASVGEHILEQSTTKSQPHGDAFVKRWARHMIRRNKARLVRLGVDVPKTYLEWGGLLEDLDD